MAEVKLTAEAGRGTGKAAARQVRREGKVPAVVYGLGAESVAVAVSDRELGHILSGPGGANTLIDLEIDGRRELVLARQVQRHPVRHSLVHVDLVRVSRDLAVAAEVPVHLRGEAVGVKDGGRMEQLVFTLSIQAKPADLPPSIDADVSALGIGDRISVADLELPPGVTTTQESHDIVVHVTQPRGLALPEEEAAAAAEAAEAEAAEAAAAGEAPPAAEPGETAAE